MFKIGDKVKLNGTRRFGCLRDKHLTVDHFERDFIMVSYGKRDTFPLCPSEIELVIKIGKQLEFSFM